jgi:hypothetical protein
MNDWLELDRWLWKIRPAIIVSSKSKAIKRYMEIWPTHKKLIVRAKEIVIDGTGQSDKARQGEEKTIPKE